MTAPTAQGAKSNRRRRAAARVGIELRLFEAARAATPNDEKEFRRAKMEWFGALARDPSVWRKGRAHLPVAWQIAEHLNRQKSYAWPKMETIANIIGSSKTSVVDALKFLRAECWLFAEVSRKRGNRYALNLAKVQPTGLKSEIGPDHTEPISTAHRTSEDQRAGPPEVQPTGPDTSYTLLRDSSYERASANERDVSARHSRPLASMEESHPKTAVEAPTSNACASLSDSRGFEFQRPCEMDPDDAARERVQDKLVDMFGTAAGYQIAVLLSADQFDHLTSRELDGSLTARLLCESIPTELIRKAEHAC